MPEIGYLVVALCSALVASGLFFLIASVRYSPEQAVATDPATFENECVFQFCDTKLVDLTEEASGLLTLLDANPMIDDFSDLHAGIASIFPDFPKDVPDGDLLLKSQGFKEGLFSEICRLGPFTRVSVFGRPFSPLDLETLRNAQEEVEFLRSVVDSAPHPMWRESAKGQVIWANAPYRKLESQITNSGMSGVFDLPLPKQGSDNVRRVQLETTREPSPSWFEISTTPCAGEWLRYATNINAVVRAETTQHNFVQTLAKTFAHLQTGLAIFGRDRRLALFNPAMLDLTGLPPDFLGNRPTLMSFFDHLREARIMPEPKNYSNWREKLAELVAAASDDRYDETWSLPSGLTYRITGRPHPDGAIAFLIDDISAEISLTRRFRSEMEINQSVLDSFDDAVAVFSNSGVLTLANAAYRQLWASDPGSSFSELTIVDATKLWSKLCKPSGIWAELRDFVTDTQERASWEFDLCKHSGQWLQCLAEPVASGATMLRFTRVDHIMENLRRDAKSTVA